MKNIMKSILYEVLHSKLLIRIYLLFILVQAFIGILNLDAFNPEQPTVSNMVADGGYIAYEFPLFVLALIVGTMVGEDYRDKVANYEVMSGHSRKSIFLARSLMATFIAAFACSVLAFIPMLAGSVFADWGNTGYKISAYVLSISQACSISDSSYFYNQKQLSSDGSRFWNDVC